MDINVENSDTNDNVATDLIETARIAGAQIALVDGEHEWTFERLLNEASHFAADAARRGVEPGDRVAIIVGSWPEHVACWYGTLLAGAVVVDINILLGDEEWKGILDDAQPALVVCEPTFEVRLRSIGVIDTLAPLTVRAAGLGPGAARAHPEARSADDIAIIAYTSGTTGLPKGVVHTHGAVQRQLDLLADLHDLSPGDFVYQAIPLFPIHGFLPQVASALRGGAAVLLADKFSVPHFATVSRRYPITYVTLSSPMLQRVLELPDDVRPVLGSLRVVTVGGAPLQPEVRRRFEEALGVHVTQGYGMTEMLGAYVADYGGAPFGSCGRQHPSGADLVIVVDDDGRPIQSDALGEFAVHRSCAMREYWNDPERTANSFAGDWYLTGDVGRIDQDGFYFLVDRKKDVIIRGGYNIYSAEIERVLDERPEVAEACVVGRADVRLGEVPIAYIVPTDGNADPQLSSILEQHVRDRLGSLKTVEQVIVVAYDDLPRNALGKVLKRRLRSRGYAAFARDA
jgi:long-chain acyl-CoA synthetase